jgi:hypothetical protein
LHDPVVAHIQRVRHYTEIPGKPVPSFMTVSKKYASEMAPNFVGIELTPDGYRVAYKRLFEEHWYGVNIQFDAQAKVVRHDRRRGFQLTSSNSTIGFKLTTETSQKIENRLKSVINIKPLNTAPFGKDKAVIDRLLDDTAIEITHLIRNNKTSGFDYGTVFPRDWMESADLGEEDLTPEAQRYMFDRTLDYVNAQGVGWHENIVGEFEYERRQEVRQLAGNLEDLTSQAARISEALRELIGQVEEMYIQRNMIDIEPRYLISMQSHRKNLSSEALERLRKVAHFIVVQAQINDLITFKRLPALLRRHKHDEYYSVGNWRDSEHAFKQVHPVIAPYDVNVVFYPLALRIIGANARKLNADSKLVKELIEKWDRVKDWYQFQNKDGLNGYALALYDIVKSPEGVKYKRLEVNHLDEGYQLFYGQPTEEEVVDLSRRLIDPDYFYTPVGPILVGAHEGYNTKQYHGKVIWTKQTAYVVAGLGKQLSRAKELGWMGESRDLIREALVKTSKSSLAAFIQLGGVPELHYERGGKAHFYTEQRETEGPMNRVQLWSAIGARRIIRTYLSVISSHAKARTGR